MHKLIIYIAFIFITINVAYSKNDTLKQRNYETYLQWDKIIKTQAPSERAFNVMLNFANRHYENQRAILAYEVFNMYKSYFPNRDSIINQYMENCENVMLTQEISDDLIGYYVKYINKNAPTENAYVAVIKLIGKFVNRADWDSAAFVLKTFKPLFPAKSKHFDKVIEILKKPIEGIKIRNIGPKINTYNSEWDPNPTLDGKYLFFSSSNRKGGYGSSDVWYSSLENGQWTTPKNLGKPVNGINDETIDNISADGNSLLLSGDFPGTFGRFDIYNVERNETGWGELVHFPFPINSRYVDEAANFTADGKAIIFTSDRPGAIGGYYPQGNPWHGGTHGNQDIYIAFMTDSGWTMPINLGPTINTPFSERSPFLHPDGNSLYFSSEGHPGLGGLDVFVSHRLSDTSWTEWSEPINLGKEINTANDNWGYKVGLSGDSAFFATINRMDSYGFWDIYSVTMPKSMKPNKVITIRGNVRTSSGMPISADIIWKDSLSGEIIGQLRSNPIDGAYFIVVPHGKKITYSANKSKYYSINNYIDLNKFKDKDEFINDIVLYTKEEIFHNKQKIIIDNVLFEFNKSDLKTEASKELDKLVIYLNERPNSSIKVEGHTDNSGSQEYNLKLSKERAESVRAYLVSKGIPFSRITTSWFGASKPLKPNDSESNKLQNRRVEIIFSN